MLLTAARAAERMVDGEDFDPRMLRLAMQMASERGMRALLWAVLDLLLRAVRGKLGPRLSRLDFEVEGITLARCLIRMGREELNSAGADALESCSSLPPVALTSFQGGSRRFLGTSPYDRYVPFTDTAMFLFDESAQQKRS
jgi:hypothetical protein